MDGLDAPDGIDGVDGIDVDVGVEEQSYPHCFTCPPGEPGPEGLTGESNRILHCCEHSMLLFAKNFKTRIRRDTKW